MKYFMGHLVALRPSVEAVVPEGVVPGETTGYVSDYATPGRVWVTWVRPPRGEEGTQYIQIATTLCRDVDLMDAPGEIVLRG